MNTKKQEHGNVAEMHRFRQTDDGRWQRCLRHHRPSVASNWKTLLVVVNGEAEAIDKTGRVWLKQQSNRWLWK